MAENPFDDFPKTHTYNSSLDMTFNIENCGPFAEWRVKWEPIIVKAMDMAAQFEVVVGTLNSHIEALNRDAEEMLVKYRAAKDKADKWENLTKRRQ